MLTHKRLKEVLTYNPETGDFTRNFGVKGHGIDDVVGSVKERGRIVICVDYKMYKAHRLAWLYMTGEFPEEIIDHIDRNPSNNKWNNLRVSTASKNQLNREHNLGILGARGIDKRCGKYRAKIKINGKVIYLGTFDHLEDAIMARQVAEDKYR